MSTTLARIALAAWLTLGIVGLRESNASAMTMDPAAATAATTVEGTIGGGITGIGITGIGIAGITGGDQRQSSLHQAGRSAEHFFSSAGMTPARQ